MRVQISVSNSAAEKGVKVFPVAPIVSKTATVSSLLSHQIAKQRQQAAWTCLGDAAWVCIDGASPELEGEVCEAEQLSYLNCIEGNDTAG